MKHNIYLPINVSLKQASFLRKKIFGPLHFRVAFEKNMCEKKMFYSNITSLSKIHIIYKCGVIFLIFEEIYVYCCEHNSSAIRVLISFWWMCVLPCISYFNLDVPFETKYVLNVVDKYIFQFLIVTSLCNRFMQC